jgi:DNA-directed RNA polymerase specialized sigma54-like protein
MMTLDAIIEELADRNLRTVAERTKLHYATVLRVAKGREERVSYGTVKKLSDYLEGKLGKEEGEPK